MIASFTTRALAVALALGFAASASAMPQPKGPADKTPASQPIDTGPGGGKGKAPTGEIKDIVQTALDSGKHARFCEALKAADLLGVLKSKGSFTVFVPTDDAFKRLPAGTWESWMKPENKAELAKVLRYHVIKGVAIKADDLKAMADTRPTEHGDKIKIAVKNSRVWLNGKASIALPDIACTNGVIHVVDAVLLPPAPKPAKPDDKKPGDKSPPDKKPADKAPADADKPAEPKKPD